MQWLKDGVNLDDLTAAVELTRQGRLRLVDGRVPEVLPGLCLEPTFDTYTYGHQHVVDNEHDGTWVLPGDAVDTYANVEGVDGSGTARAASTTASTWPRCRSDRATAPGSSRGRQR
jgi:hypothetical protein